MEDNVEVSDTNDDNGADGADLGGDDSLGGMPFTDASKQSDDNDDDWGDDADDSVEVSSGNQNDAPKTTEEMLALLAGKEAPARNAALTPDQIKAINALGASWKDQPIQVKDQNELKELIQKGYDYTRKSMERADLEKQKDAEYAERETKWKEKEQSFENERAKLSQQVGYFNLVDSMFRKLQRNDPDLADTFANLLTAEEEQVNAHNPLLDKMQSNFNALEQKLKLITGERETEKLAIVRQGFEKDMKEIESQYAAMLSQYGIRLKKDEIQKIWASDKDNQMTVIQAFQSIHGEDIKKAYESKIKLAEAKLKQHAARSSRTATGSGGSRPSAGKKYAVGDYDSILRS